MMEQKLKGGKKMTIKKYCDECGEELKKDELSDFKIGKWNFKVICNLENTYYDGILCFKCFKRLVSEGEIKNEN